MSEKYCPGFDGVCEEQNKTQYSGVGRRVYCPTCKQKADARSKRRSAERRLTPEYREWFRNYKNGWRKRNPGYETQVKRVYREEYPDRAKAQNWITNHKKELTEPTHCQWGGCYRKDCVWHHPDYTKPRYVVWLCQKHHKVADKQRRLLEDAE